MTFVHKELAGGRWRTLSVIQQLANIGSEIERALSWRKKGNDQHSMLAFERGLELLDLSIQDPANKKRLRELCRLREALVDYFMGENMFRSSDDLWHKYFYAFAYAQSLQRS